MSPEQEYLKAMLALTERDRDNHYFAAFAFCGFVLGALAFMLA